MDRDHMNLRPSRVYLDVTNACQLRCRHCCTGSGIPFEDELSLEEVTSVLDQVRQMEVKDLVFSGGEPLLRPELPAMVRHARGLGLTMTLLTNGLLIDGWWRAFLLEAGVRVKVSLDGATAATHDALRGADAFDRTCQVLQALASAGAPDLTVHYTVHRRNLAELARLPPLLGRLGVVNLVIGTIKPSGRAGINEDLLIPPSMVPYVQQRVRAVKRRAGVVVQQHQDRGWEGFGCPATCNKLGLTASGRLTTCAFFGPGLLGGSVREHTLAELWEQHLSRSDLFVVNPACAACPALPVTGGGCRARALHYHGDLNAPDPYCCALMGKARFLERHRDLLRAAAEDVSRAFA